jgi:hypothetical protein
MVAPGAFREKHMVVSPVGLGTKKHCAGEDQQQICFVLFGSTP